MKILKIDHLGIAVHSIEEARKLFGDTLGLEFEGTETVEEQKVSTRSTFSFCKRSSTYFLIIEEVK